MTTTKRNYGERYLIHARVVEARRRRDEAFVALEKAVDEWHQAWIECDRIDGEKEGTMTDIVPLLREGIGLADNIPDCEAIMDAAAAEIEQLRAALAEAEKLATVLRAKLDILRGHYPSMPRAIGEPNWGEGQSPSAGVIGGPYEQKASDPDEGLPTAEDVRGILKPYRYER